MKKFQEERAEKYAKPNLPEKICAACGKPMTWRKRWAKVWEQVKFCSERCRKTVKSEK